MKCCSAESRFLPINRFGATKKLWYDSLYTGRVRVRAGSIGRRALKCNSLVAAMAAFAIGSNSPISAQDQQLDAQSAIVAEEETIADEDVEEVAFDHDRYERMTIPVTIAGSGPYRFFIDTGSQATAVTHKITEDLGLEPRGKAILVAMGSQRRVDMIDIDGLEFADRVFSGLRSPLLHRSHIGADGILGLDSLQNLRVLIDFEEDRMDVTDATQLRSSNRGFDIVVRARRQLGQMIITDAEVNGVRTAVVVDTGAQNSIGNMALMQRLRKRGDDIMRTTDVNGVQFESNYIFAREIKMGGVQIFRAPIGFSDSPAFEALGLTDQPALIIGMSNLRLFERVAIDFAQQKVLFDLPESAKRSLIELGRGRSRIRS